MAAADEITVGVVGLGSMGLGMAGALAAAGFRVKGFDLSDARRSMAAGRAVTPAASLADAFAGAQFLVFSLPAAKDVAAVVNANLDRLGAAGSDRVVILDTSGLRGTADPSVDPKR